MKASLTLDPTMGGDVPLRRLRRTIIYEMHVEDLRHQFGSDEQIRGSYAGLIEDSLPATTGDTAVELLRVPV